MSFRSLAAATLLMAPIVTACAPDTTVDRVEQSATDEGAVADGVIYVVTGRDFRKCAYPMCSGFFVKAVNKAKTTCFDGTKQAECYVSAIDTSALGLSGTQGDELRAAIEAGQVLLSAELSPLDEPEGVPPGFAELRVHQAFQAKTGHEVTGTHYAVAPNGITCITAPCASLDAQKLNSTSVKRITDLDLSKLGLSDEEQQSLLSAAFEDELLVAGTISTHNTATGQQKRLTVSEVFVATTANPPAEPSCVDACGGPSADGSCYCDDLCVDYGDCCADHASVCL